MEEIKRANRFKKISAEVTIEFYDRLNDKAHELKMTKSELIRKAVSLFISSN